MISPREALLTYKTIILLKIHYPLLPMCFFPEEEAEMESLILLHLLPKMVINCHFPRVVIHGPKSLCGLALPKLETIQAWSHTRFILCHLWRNSHIAPLLWISIENLQLHIGPSQAVLSGTFSKMPLPVSWIGETWRMLHKKGMKNQTKQGNCFSLAMLKWFPPHGSVQRIFHPIPTEENKCLSHVYAWNHPRRCNWNKWEATVTQLLGWVHSTEKYIEVANPSQASGRLFQSMAYVPAPMFLGYWKGPVGPTHYMAELQYTHNLPLTHSPCQKYHVQEQWRIVGSTSAPRET